MFFESALPTKVRALDVAGILDRFIKEGIAEKYIPIEIIRSADEEETTIRLRPMLEQNFFLNADDSQIVHCIAEDGSRVDILIPPLALRETTPAGVVIGPLPT